MSHEEPTSTAMEELLKLVYPPIESNEASAPASLLAELEGAKSYCRARLEDNLSDLTNTHCMCLLTSRRDDVNRLVQECIECEATGYPLATSMIALRLRSLASASPPFPDSHEQPAQAHA